MPTLARDVTKTECPWLDHDLKAGEVVHRYHGATYGCVGAGIAVTEKKDEKPFFEIPSDALKE